MRISLIGFGEAGQAFVSGWQKAGIAADYAAFDIKTEEGNAATVEAKRQDYDRYGIIRTDSRSAALAESDAVFCVVTADRALEAARDAARDLPKGAYFFDCNSCAPGTKQQSAEIIQAAGGRYIDAAVMAPVHPKLHQVPILLSGPHAEEALHFLNGSLDGNAKLVPGDVGAASSIKMIRSVAMKGLEAILLECVLAGRKAGVADTVLDSLEQTWPGFDWKKRSAYMMERAATHGVRRAAEMREVAKTVREFGFDGWMADATALWEDKIGALGLKLESAILDDHNAVADALLEQLNMPDI